MLDMMLNMNGACFGGTYFVGCKKVYAIWMLMENEGKCSELKAMVGMARTQIYRDLPPWPWELMRLIRYDGGAVAPDRTGW